MKSSGTYLSHFDGDILVKCPKCGACSHLLKHGDGYRNICPTCSHTREWSLQVDGWLPVPGGGATLFGFELELWLQTACAGNTLWAFNAEHIDFLKDLIGSKLREREPDPNWGWCNAAMESRLPKWMLAKSNRDQVLKGLERLEQMM